MPGTTLQADFIQLHFCFAATEHGCFGETKAPVTILLQDGPIPCNEGTIHGAFIYNFFREMEIRLNDRYPCPFRFGCSSFAMSARAGRAEGGGGTA